MTEAARFAIDHGADEIDVVLPFRAFMAGDLDWCAALLDGVHVATEGSAHMKVILETGELDSVDRMTEAARFAIDHGADFVKTSTGKTTESATHESVGALLTAIAAADRTVGLKPSGGISTADAADEYLTQVEAVMGHAYLAPATFRFGASGVLDALAIVAAG
jgi:deoxyribose-phosphate aldolase